MRNTQSGGGEAERKIKEREEDIEKEGMERGRRKRDPDSWSILQTHSMAGG